MDIVPIQIGGNSLNQPPLPVGRYMPDRRLERLRGCVVCLWLGFEGEVHHRHSLGAD